MARTRRLVGLLTLLLLLAIAINISGFELPMPRLGTASPSQPALPGVRVVAANTVLEVGASAPADGQLAFMALDPGGNLVVSDAKRRTLMRFDPSGHLLSDWGPRIGDTELGEPAGVAVAGGNYYLIDRGAQPRILRLDAAGQLQAIFSLEALSTYGLNGLAVDAGGNIYAADTGRNRILVFSPTGQLIKQIGRGGSDIGAFTQPMMLAFAPDGGFFVADWENSRIERWDVNFEATNAWNTPFRAFGVAVDPLGRVFVPDTDHRRVEAYTAQGASLGELGEPNSPRIDVAPRQLAAPRAGPPSLYVLGNDAIQRLDLENTAPPPQGGAGETDLIGLLVIALLVALVVLAIVARRQRQANTSLVPALHRPVGLEPVDPAQRQHQQANADQKLLVAHQPKGKE